MKRFLATSASSSCWSRSNRKDAGSRRPVGAGADRHALILRYWASPNRTLPLIGAMALYEYECTSCGDAVETLREMAERDAAATCAMPGCGGELRRVISNPSVQFHGPGFTRTPSIMRDPIAQGSAMHGTNWGTTGRELGSAVLEDD